MNAGEQILGAVADSKRFVIRERMENYRVYTRIQNMRRLMSSTTSDVYANFIGNCVHEWIWIMYEEFPI